jgi:hypothetical protein
MIRAKLLKIEKKKTISLFWEKDDSLILLNELTTIYYIRPIIDSGLILKTIIPQNATAYYLFYP